MALTSQFTDSKGKLEVGNLDYQQQFLKLRDEWQEDLITAFRNDPLYLRIKLADLLDPSHPIWYEGLIKQASDKMIKNW